MPGITVQSRQALQLALKSDASANEVGNALDAVLGGTNTITSATITTLTSTTATITTINPTNIVRASQTYKIGRGGTAKAGTTAGWTVNAGNNLGTIGTVAQSQTNSTLVVAIPNLHVGDTITAFG